MQVSEYVPIPLQWLRAAFLLLFCMHASATWASCKDLTSRPTLQTTARAKEYLFSAPDGSTSEKAHPLDPSAKVIQRMALAPGLPCHVRFTIPLSMRVQFSLEGDPAAVLPSLKVSATDRQPQRSIEGLRSPDGRHVSFDLTAASYELAVPPLHDATGAPGSANLQLELVATSWTNLSPQWELAPGASVTLRMDPIARLAERKIVLARRSMITFSLGGVPPLQRFHPWVGIDLFDRDGKELRSAEHSEYEAATPRASFVVPAGTYYVVAHNRYNGWPSPELEEPLRDRDLTLRMEAMVPADLSPNMQRLDDWLIQVGLGALIEISEVLDLRETSYNLPGAVRRLGPDAIEVTGYRAKRNKGREGHEEVSATIVDDTIQWPSTVDVRDRPVLVILFSLKTDNRWAFGATEDALKSSQGASIWSRLLQRISSLEGISARTVAMVAPVPCDPHLVFLTDAGRAERHGASCTSESSSAPLASVLSLAPASTAKVDGQAPKLGSKLPSLLKKYFGPAPAELEFLTADDDFVEVMVRGLRGWVVRGGRDWEKLQLTLALTNAGAAPTLRVTADGDLASGIGNYPPDSSFSRSMDYQHKGQLSDFVKKLAGDLAKQLTSNSLEKKQ